MPVAYKPAIKAINPTTAIPTHSPILFEDLPEAIGCGALYGLDPGGGVPAGIPPAIG